MATRTSQRIAIGIIAVVMLVGTIGFYFLTVGEMNQQNEQAKEQQKFLEQYKKQQERMAKPAETLSGYAAAPFDAGTATTLQKEDLKVGTGKTVSDKSKIKVNYFGWTPDGKIFDSTNRGGEVEPADFDLAAGLIDGWKQGIPGMKEGGVRKLVIPASLAYKEAGSPPSIGPNTPLTYIIEILQVS